MYALQSSFPTLDQIDDLGLTPVQFRIYCRLLRLSVNGVVSESIDLIAKACGIAKITVIRTLTQLEQTGIIECDRTPGKKSVFRLTPFENWKPQKKDKVVQFRKDTSISDLPVSEINQQQESRNTPLKGCSVDSAVLEPVNKSDQLTFDTPADLSLDEKIEQARQLGYSCCAYQEGSEIKIRINSKSVGVEEFLGRSLESFKNCVEDNLAMIQKCWQVLSKALARMDASKRADLIKDRLKKGMPPLDSSVLLQS